MNNIYFETSTSEARLINILKDLKNKELNIFKTYKADIYDDKKLSKLVENIMKSRKFFIFKTYYINNRLYLIASKNELNDIINLYLYNENIKLKIKKETWGNILGKDQNRTWAKEELYILLNENTKLNINVNNINDNAKRVFEDNLVKVISYENNKNFESIELEEELFYDFYFEKYRNEWISLEKEMSLYLSSRISKKNLVIFFINLKYGKQIKILKRISKKRLYVLIENLILWLKTNQKYIKIKEIEKQLKIFIEKEKI